MLAVSDANANDERRPACPALSARHMIGIDGRMPKRLDSEERATNFVSWPRSEAG